MPVTAAIDNETLDHLLSVVERCPRLRGIRRVVKAPARNRRICRYSGLLAHRAPEPFQGQRHHRLAQIRAGRHRTRPCNSAVRSRPANSAAHSGKSALQTCFATSWIAGARPPRRCGSPRRAACRFSRHVGFPGEADEQNDIERGNDHAGQNRRSICRFAACIPPLNPRRADATLATLSQACTGNFGALRCRLSGGSRQ